MDTLLTALQQRAEAAEREREDVKACFNNAVRQDGETLGLLCRLEAEYETTRADLEQVKLERDEALKSMVSSKLEPCTIHTDFQPGCVRCIVKKAMEADALRADLGRAVTALQEAIIWAVEWTAKQTTTRDTWPLSWEAGFPGLKAQALLDYAALTPSALSAGEEAARMREIVKTAQWIARRTPRPPTDITYEVGVDIVNLVQKELCPVVDALSHPAPTTPGPAGETP